MKKRTWVIDIVAIIVGGLITLYMIPTLAWSVFDLFVLGEFRSMYLGEFYLKMFLGILFLTVLGLVLLICGFLSILRWRRYRFYQSLLSTRSYMMVAELAKETGYSRERVQKDLRGMIRRRCLPGAKIDALRGCVILQEDLWREYQYEWRKWEQTKARLAQNEIPESEYLLFLEAKDQMEDIQKWQDKICDVEMKEHIGAAADRLGQALSEVTKFPEKLRQHEKTMIFHIPQLYQLTKKYAQLETLDVKVKDSDCAKELIAVLKMLA